MKFSKAEILADTADLFEELFSFCPNGVIPSKFFAKALENQHAKDKVYHRNQDVFLWAPDAGGRIRALTPEWRDIRNNEQARATCFRQASVAGPYK